jgi:hypothetical protein
MIYSKTLEADWGKFFFNGFQNIRESKFEPDAIYLFDRHDTSLRDTMFRQCLPEEHWEHFRNSPGTKLLIFFPDEYFNILDLREIYNTIIEKKLKTNQLYFLVMDNNFKEFAENFFKVRGITDIHVHALNLLLSGTVNPDTHPTQSFKFSALSRNYNIWRLHVYAALQEKNLLKDFIYSFHNINPYVKYTFEVPQLIGDLKEHWKPELNQGVLDWIDNVPYNIGHAHNKHHNITYHTIKSADFHLLIESHFDPYWNFVGRRGEVSIDDFSPAFPTEKTYKTMICEKPFIAFSTPYFLKGLRQLGFKTFSPYIDETYDVIENDKARVEAIVCEVERICNLPESEYTMILEKCKEITEFNKQLFLDIKKNTKLNEEFLFLDSCFNQNTARGKLF